MNAVHMILSRPDLKSKVMASVRAPTMEEARKDAFEVLKIMAAYGITLEFMTET